MRMQRCSISAVCGYSAWSMKLRCRFSAITRCASGSIQVVTNVARLRIGIPSSTSSSSISRIASVADIPCSGSWWSGAGSSRKRFPYALARASSCVAGRRRSRSSDRSFGAGGSSWGDSSVVAGEHHGADQEVEGAERGGPVGGGEVEDRARGPGARSSTTTAGHSWSACRTALCANTRRRGGPRSAGKAMAQPWSRRRAPRASPVSDDEPNARTAFAARNTVATPRWSDPFGPSAAGRTRAIWQAPRRI